MSSLGFLSVYSLINQRPDALAERFFYMGEVSPLSVESKRELRDFHIAAASLSLENDYWAFPAMLKQSGIPPLARERQDFPYPLVLAGGIGPWSNPWPLLPFADLILAGEAEPQWPVLLDLYRDSHFISLSREERLSVIGSSVPGALLPSGLREAFLSPSSLESAVRGFRPVIPARLSYPFAAGLLPPVSPILAKEAEFSMMRLVEISRGCPYGCRFCLAGNMYRPMRPWPAGRILEALGDVSRSPKVGLISPAVADHPEFAELLDSLSSQGRQTSFSSLRLSALSPGLAERLAQSGVKGLAIAPEAGTEGLRRLLNKDYSQAEILESAHLLSRAGLKSLKLYFMLGLPGESDEDLAGIANLAREIQEVSRGGGKAGPKISLSVANFTPKPHTPLEDAPLLSFREWKAKGERLSRFMAGARGIELRLDPPGYTLVQGLLARSGPEAEGLMLALMKWSGKSLPSLREIGGLSGHPGFAEGDMRPWRIISPPSGLGYLEMEKKAIAERKLSPKCPISLCCGSCQACPPNR
jgi:radical SAM superfamily enzyme YgiQ (UPF0313 family)